MALVEDLLARIRRKEEEIHATDLELKQDGLKKEKRMELLLVHQEQLKILLKAGCAAAGPSSGRTAAGGVEALDERSATFMQEMKAVVVEVKAAVEEMKAAVEEMKAAVEGIRTLSITPRTELKVTASKCNAQEGKKVEVMVGSKFSGGGPAAGDGGGGAGGGGGGGGADGDGGAGGDGGASSDEDGSDGDEGLKEAARENYFAQAVMSILRQPEAYEGLFGQSEPPTSFRPPTREEILASFSPREALPSAR